MGDNNYEVILNKGNYYQEKETLMELIEQVIFSYICKHPDVNIIGISDDIREYADGSLGFSLMTSEGKEETYEDLEPYDFTPAMNQRNFINLVELSLHNVFNTPILEISDLDAHVELTVHSGDITYQLNIAFELSANPLDKNGGALMGAITDINTVKDKDSILSAVVPFSVTGYVRFKLLVDVDYVGCMRFSIVPDKYYDKSQVTNPTYAGFNCEIENIRVNDKPTNSPIGYENLEIEEITAGKLYIDYAEITHSLIDTRF